MMPKRKKRLRKGIESIRSQVETHRKKLEEARKLGNIGLAGYYEKEIESMVSALEKKKRMLGK